MGFPLQLCLVALIFASGVENAQAAGMFSFGVNPITYDGGSVPIDLDYPFVYAERNYTQLYLNMNGFLSFFEPPDEFYPDPNVAGDGIFPLWADIENNEGGYITYIQTTEDTITSEVADILKLVLGEFNSNVTSVFAAMWWNTPLELESANVTFEVALITDNEGHSYVLVNYVDVPPLQDFVWLAGFAVNNNINFLKLPVTKSSDLSLTSNTQIPSVWAFTVEDEPNVIFFPIGPEAIVNPFSGDGTSVQIELDYPFVYNGTKYTSFYLDMNGFIAFFQPEDEYYPDPHVGRDMIAPFWADIENDWSGTVSYEQATSGPLIAIASYAVQQAFPDADFDEANWAFVATWEETPLEDNDEDVSFQVLLVSDDDGRAYVFMNYQDIPYLPNEEFLWRKNWLAGFAENNNYNFNSLSVSNSSDLPVTSNVGINGRWAFNIGINVSCETLQCTENEVCVEKTGIYGCDCSEDNLRPNPDTFDVFETCSGSSGTISLSRCQLFEAGYSTQFLHLNDPKCKGVMESERVVFHFDNDGHKCGTVLRNNATHFIYENNIQALMGMGDNSVISRDNWLDIVFSCVYPLIQSISMPMVIQAEPSVIYKNLPTEGSYQIHMVPYTDASFSTTHSGEVIIAVNQQIFVAVDVVGVDNRQISTVLDRCWATPSNDINDEVYWDLINHGCPNGEDGTVQVLQNGDSTSGRFSFRMFTFTAKSDKIYLHCKVHLCLVESEQCIQTCFTDFDGDRDSMRRRRRSVDFHDTAAISMSF